MQTFLRILSLFILPVYAHTDITIFNGNPINIQWSDYGTQYEYMVEVYQLKEEQRMNIYTSEWILDSNVDLEILEESSYEWDTYIREIGKTCEEDYQCFNIESGYFDFYKLPEDIPDAETDIPSIEANPIEDVAEVIPPTPPAVLGVTTEYIPKEDYKPKRKDVVRDIEEKDTGINTCRYIYNVKNKKFKLGECNISLPSIESATYNTYNDQYIPNVKGSYQDTLKIYIDNIVCSNFDILHPKTWFGCEENTISGNEYTVDFEHEVYFFRDKKVISPINFIFRDKYYEISSVLSNLPTDIVDKGYFSVQHSGKWLDQEVVYKRSASFTEIDYDKDNSAIYDFPFKSLVPVNQWHGCTKYQCPHTGIDFASVKENIYASAKGTVVAKGYDTYNGKCRSGGNYLLIKYYKDQHMSYMHLEKSFVNTGDTVNKGQVIALSGNSGSYNCQPLGYHLHYELREQRPQSAHINPVPYINISWNLIKTNRSDTFPKRLSGDNPHPSF